MTTALDTSPAAGGCEHLPHMRRLIDGESVCTTCGTVVNTNNPAAYPRDRPGAVAPEPRAGGLRHLDPASYTPPQLEQEILDTLDRLERGAGFLVSKQEERSTAHMAYELAYARAIVRSSSRSADQRKAEAMLACEHLWTAWQVLDQVCKTTAEGLHNLRAKESGLQSVLRSVTQAMRSAGQGFTP